MCIQGDSTCTNHTGCDKGTLRRLPTAAIIGVAKSGTTALMWFLKLNPLIRTLDEHYLFNTNCHDGVQKWCNLTECVEDGGIVVDKTPSYFPNEFVPDRIANYNNQTKLLLIVREPYERMLSHLAHFHGSDLTWTAYKDIVINNLTGLINDDALAVRLSHYSR